MMIEKKKTRESAKAGIFLMRVFGFFFFFLLPFSLDFAWIQVGEIIRRGGEEEDEEEEEIGNEEERREQR